MASIEVAKLRKALTEREEFESIIKCLLQKNELINGTVINLPTEDFSALNQFKDIHSILINDIPVSEQHIPLNVTKSTF